MYDRASVGDRMRMLKFFGTVGLIVGGLAPAAARAECPKPETNALASEQARLEGEVSVTVAALGGGDIQASSDQTRTWQTQLPSQGAVDNQWYLYYVCREYEARRITRDQYCSISSGIWERILGQPMEAAECAARPAGAGAGAPAPQATVTLQSSGTVEQPPTVAAPTPQAVAVPRGRWTVLLADGRAVDIFGPVRLNGKELWYVENDAGCLSVLTPLEGGSFEEEMLVGAMCTPWQDVRLTVSPQLLVLDAEGEHLEFDYVDPAPGRPPDGRWAGTLDFTVPPTGAPSAPKGLKVAMGIINGVVGGAAAPQDFPVELTVDRRGGTVAWGVTECKTKLGEPRTGAGWVQFTERSETDSNCVDGAKVTLQALSSDAVLMQWSNGSLAAQGMLRLAE
jgi:hypothetical protein